MIAVAVAGKTLARLLARLEESKRRVGEVDPAQLEKLLLQVAAQRFADAPSLARFHDALLFLRAHPPSRRILRRVESELGSFADRIDRFQKAGGDLSPLDDEQVSGIAGTTLSADFHYDQVCWLVKNFPRTVSIDWEGYENNEALAATLPRFIPLLADDSLVEPDVPYRRWMEAASGGSGRALSWLIAQLQKLPLNLEEQAEIFGSLKLPVRWELGDSTAARTHGRLPVRQVFYQREPLMGRSQVRLAKEFAKPPLKLQKLRLGEGEKILDLCREATTVRYRELYGTTRGDPASVFKGDVGRGVEIFLWGLPPERRLPLRAYQAGFTLKNGVPINYIEGISLFEWAEVGFNTFYAYREAETAWIYAQVLRLVRQILGVSSISVYPYQIGQDNEEAIQSGAFWFYRKLGFRPMRSDLAKVVAEEEMKIRNNPLYRTPARTLRRLAQGHVVYELGEASRGNWDRFRMRNVGLAVERGMASRFRGDISHFRQAAGQKLARLVDVDPRRWSPLEQKALRNFALVLDLVPGVARWTKAERDLLVAIIRAKAGATEPEYSRLLQAHSRLRAAILKLGSSEEK
jgi:hypothetical protein